MLALLLWLLDVAATCCCCWWEFLTAIKMFRFSRPLPRPTPMACLVRGKQRGGIVRFSMYIHMYIHTHTYDCPKVKGSLVCMNWLTRESVASVASAATKCVCQTTLFVRSGIHEIFMQAKKKKTRLTAMPMLSARRSCSRSEFQYIQARAWSWHRGASGFIGLPDGVDENWRVQCSRQLLQFDDRIVQNGSRVARNP